MLPIIPEAELYAGGARARLARSVVASPGVCPICGAPAGTRKTCSGKCRAELSRRTRAGKQAERDGRLRRLAEAILRELGMEDSS